MFILEKVYKYRREGDRMNHKKISILLGIICMLLTIGICVQIKTVNDSSTGVGKTQKENELRNNVLKWKEKYEQIYQKEEAKLAKLDELRTQVGVQDTDSIQLTEELQKVNTLLGYHEVSGQGLIITLKDANSSTVSGNATDYIVHDGDLLEVINALKNAGAEAISMNGQRITNSTAITCAGNITKVNGEKVGSPFQIKAIGLTEKLNGALTMPGGYLQLLEEDGVQVKVEEVENIVIPKYNGVYNFQYAENVK